ncbi:MAG: peptide chain release factor N(5)-glutamine methyltransferase [Campylobacteraceae bacterium]|jgi:release factor glutamine methyltransferase|nr:peptide chain release factor N(5)-glutamine methyltransferase [Campylobacteraceae bacterium]
MTIKEAIDIASKKLTQSVINPRKEAMLLLGFFLNKDSIFLHVNDTLQIDDVEGFFELVEKRANYTPLEYITKRVSFYSREFKIEEGVLIPRPETEILVEKTAEIIKQTNAKYIAEIGTGSGIISIMLAILCKDIKIVATDINEKALILAKKNAKLHKVDDRIEFLQTNLIDNIKKPQILVSNPPYISKNELLEKHVLNEPHNALFGGENGDELLKKISLIYKDNDEILSLICEMGYDQKNSMSDFFEKENIENYSFYKDLSGFDRGFIIKRRDFE